MIHTLIQASLEARGQKQTFSVGVIVMGSLAVPRVTASQVGELAIAAGKTQLMQAWAETAVVRPVAVITSATVDASVAVVRCI